MQEDFIKVLQPKLPMLSFTNFEAVKAFTASGYSIRLLLGLRIGLFENGKMTPL